VEGLRDQQEAQRAGADPIVLEKPEIAAERIRQMDELFKI
jgi:hypothetical protein